MLTFPSLNLWLFDRVLAGMLLYPLEDADFKMLSEFFGILTCRRRLVNLNKGLRCACVLRAARV